MAADAPPNSSAEASAGRTRCDANSTGKDAAESLRVLGQKTDNSVDVYMLLVGILTGVMHFSRFHWRC